ncbi:hypothetical protein ACG7TL_004414 [Trametes sanguinea]
MNNVFQLHEDPYSGGPDKPAWVPPVPPSSVEQRTRTGRRIRPTWKVRDQLPEDVGAVVAESITTCEPTPDMAEGNPSEAGSGRRRVLLLATDYVRTAANVFGLRRFYKRRPHRPPEARTDMEACYAPTADATAATKSRRSLAQIIFPFPNISSWRFSWHYSRGYKKTHADRDDMKSLITRDDFVPGDIEGVDFRSLDKQLAAGASYEEPWSDVREGWRTSPVTIGIPLGKKPTQASRRDAAAAASRLRRHEHAPDTPAAQAVPGLHFTIPDFHHKSICAEIVKTFSSDPAARDFVYDPYLVEHGPAGSAGDEQVHGELYNSPAFVQEDLRLQNSAREPGCDLPRAIAALMFWSDATVVSQFGNQKAWPGYLYFGNQSKYTRARPTARAAHHIAYFVPLPDRIQDFIREHNNGKPASASLLTHCRRELFHAQWECIIDEEFMHAYEHGIVVDCIDGVRRRLYPRIFTYSADYPEKMLLATLRDKGRCPCPRCLTTFDQIHKMGTPDDFEARVRTARPPMSSHDNLIQEARELVYHDGYVVNSDHVEALLREQSLVPTRNAFAKLQCFGFNLHEALVVDQLHEFELGVWKAIFTQIVRILETAGTATVHELNKRFRQVPSFAWTTIRKFADNVCDMKRLAARDFEDMLQCIIPCFEGLLPEAHNDAILTLLFVAAYWHALAKMRMHTGTSLAHLEDATTVLGYELRHFSSVTCAAFDTRETQAEYDARKRADARRPGGTQATVGDGRRPRTFNINTVKMHFLGDYPSSIRQFGTTDSYTTQIGEHEHRRVKARRQRTNGVSADGQVVNLDARESRMHQMAHELCELGMDIPGLVSHSEDVADPSFIAPEVHHHIGETEKNVVDLADWQARNADDPAVQMFVPLMKAHLRERLRDAYPTLADEEVPIIVRHDRVYRHAIAYVNYTTYDLQRDQDIIHPSTDKRDILVHTPSAASCDVVRPFPWTYARVLGIYHANVLPPGETKPCRYEFLHVRWFEHVDAHQSGPLARRLDKVKFTSYSTGDAFGFVDPAHVIRACHLIPAFHHGRTKDYLPASTLARDPEGDWRYHVVNRFVDRDIFARFLGCGVGHMGLCASATESLKPPGFDAEVPLPHMQHAVPGTDNPSPHALASPPHRISSLLGNQDVDEEDGTGGDLVNDEDEEVELEYTDFDFHAELDSPEPDCGTKGLSGHRLCPPGWPSALGISAAMPSRSGSPLPSAHPHDSPELPSHHQLTDNTSALNVLVRPHAQAGTGSDCDPEERQPKKKKARRTKHRRETQLMAIGVAVGMMGDLFRDFQTILTIGITANSHSPLTTLSYRERKYRQLYQHIVALAPWIVDEVEKRGPRGLIEVANELHDGRQGVRGVDLHSIKKAIVAWDNYTPPIPPDANYDWSKPEIRQALRNRDKRYPCGATQWPTFLWEEEKADLADLQKGFLRNVRLIKGGKIAAKKPKAKIYSIRSITVPFMAYTAVLVHCSLNSQESFSDGSLTGTFPYERYYQSIVRFVEEKLPEEDRACLISWWNEQIFGSSYDDDDFKGSGESDDGHDGEPSSIMAMMSVQITARVQAKRAVPENVPASSRSAGANEWKPFRVEGIDDERTVCFDQNALVECGLTGVEESTPPTYQM